MKITDHIDCKSKILEFSSSQIILSNTQDALNLIVISEEKDARKIILYENNIHPDFYNLQSGLAGEILQKFVNYQIKIAIVGDCDKYTSKNFKDFVYESNKGNQFYFVPNIDIAKEKLNKI